MDKRKIFVIGLPRTGTTSICEIGLHLGLKVAHTAFTQAACETATLLADTPIYIDYPQLDSVFPHSKFIYLDRGVEQWLPSIKTLLMKLSPRISAQPLSAKNKRSLHPLISSSFKRVFGDVNNTEGVNPCWLDEDYLINCYQQHQHGVDHYFSHRPSDLLRLNLNTPSSLECFTRFLEDSGFAIDPLPKHLTQFPKRNQNGKINEWQQIKHPLKVDPLTFGKHRRQYFQFDEISPLS